MIIPERPGYGLSSEQPNRKIADWANDVIELADALHVESFSVSGGWGGGPCALACGALLPDRVNRILLFNSAGPFDGKEAKKGMAFGNRLGLWAARRAPGLLKFIIKLAANSFRKHPDANTDALAKQLPEADAKWMKDAEFRKAVQRDMGEAYSAGISGHYSDAMLCHRDWLVDFGRITQPVHLWHGEADNLSPIHNVRRKAAQHPNCHPRYLPAAGHFLIDLPEVVADILI